MAAVAEPAPVLTASQSPASVAPSADDRAAERARIDASARTPVLLFFLTALGWLLIATFFGFIGSYKLQSPEFLADWPIYTYGRVIPAFNACFAYGWCSLAGMGVAIWLMARLCKAEVKFPGALIFGALFWNFGLGLAVVGILIGENTGLEMMAIPRPAAWMMFIGYLFVGITGAALYRQRKHSTVFISVWYLLGAFFWFPWLFFTAHVLLGQPQLQGVMQNVVAAWFANGLNNYWFTAIGLAAAYYLIPKVIDRPIHSYNLASIGFWSWAIFGGLTAMTKLSGGPVPAWLVTLSISSQIMLLIPLVTVGKNFFKTMEGNHHMIYHSPTVRFAFFGAVIFVIATAINILASLRGADSIVHFTLFGTATNDLLLYSFYSMVMFGAIYYITPRLVGCEWLSAGMIRLHFLGSAYGGATAVAVMLCSGIAAGMRGLDPDAQFSQILYNTGAYLPGRMIGLVLVTIGHTAFGLHFLLMLLRIGQPAGQPTLFVSPGEEDQH
ncbi:MAG: cbb3-type cytochrome c oxidase subunit I [Chthoniobacteraceae bacterium]